MQKWLTVSLLLVIGIAGASWTAPVQAQGQGQGGPPEPSEIASFEYHCRSDVSGYFNTYVNLRGSSFGVANQQLTYRNGNDGSGGATVCRDVHVPAVEASVQTNGCLSSRQVYGNPNDPNRTELRLRVVCAGSRDQVIQALFDTVAYANSAGF